MNDGARQGALPYNRELARKAIHLSSAAIPVALAAGVPRNIALIVLGVLALMAVTVEVMRALSLTVASRFAALFGSLLRPHETRTTSGATWLILSMFAGVWLLPRDIAIAATWAAAVGDAAAALIGMRIGRHRSMRDGKSIEGSIACVLVTFAGAALLARLAFADAVLVSIAATIAERLPWPRDDNTRIIALVGMTALIAATLR